MVIQLLQEKVMQLQKKMLRRLREQQKAGVISASERRAKLDEEIEKNRRAFEMSKDFSRKSFLDQLAS